MLLEHGDRVLRREQLQKLDSWGGEVASNAVPVRIDYLRKKPGRDSIRSAHAIAHDIDQAPAA